MNNMDQELWQDFVVEAEENLQELEPNLLLLEQDPSNTSLLNDCFRNMHSIKGAANYMGLENIAKLSHRMETLFGRVRDGDATLDENAMNVLFDGVDRVKLLVKEVAESQSEQSGIEDILTAIDAVIDGNFQEGSEAKAQETDVQGEEGVSDTDDDAELLSIFVEELKSRLEQLEELSVNAPVEKQVAYDLVQDMIRVTNYIGKEELLAELEKKATEIEPGEEETSLLDASEIESLCAWLADLFTAHLGQQFTSSTVPAGGDIALAGEEDEELYRIFLEFVQEEGRPLAAIPPEPDSQWLEACRSAVEKLSASAHYMDYHDVLALLEEWNERLVEALSTISEQKPFDGEPLRRLWARFCAMLPGLEKYVENWETEEFTQESGGNGEEAAGVSGEEVLDALDGMDGMFEGVLPEGGDTSRDDAASFMEGEASVSQESFGGLDSALDNIFSDVETEPEVGKSSESPASESAASGQEMPKPADMFSAQTPEKGAPIPPGAFNPFTSTTPPKPEAGPSSASSGASKLVRVDLAKVERLLEDVGELVVLRATMLQIADDMKELYTNWLEDRRLSSSELKPFKQIMIRTAEQTATLEKVVHQLQDGVMRMRMLPVGTLFNRYPRIIRDLSRKLGKKVELRVHGENTALDKRVIEHITDPLQHIVRNAIDHGIEAPDVREKQGKPQAGTLTLSAGQEGNFVVITISDDGRGLDREAIIQKAVANGIVSGETARTMSDERVWNMIFLPGISTASSVSDTSGRGVGMDVVKNNIEGLGGQIFVSSAPGRGTSITLRIPLTLAIIQALLVRVGDQNMAVPLSAVQETFRIYADEISSIEGFEMISLRQETLPLIRLGKVFRGTGAEEDPEKLFVVRVRMQDMEAGLAVDRFVGQQEVVIKPLAEYLTDEPGFSGATILGDGTIALILDIPAVLERARNFTLKRQQLMEQAALGIGADGATPTFH